MIESVRLRNWKTHADSFFEFSKGTNVLVGAMGSGKSSVMDSICFALFGTFPALQARRVALEEVIMNKPVQAEEASVELAFSYAGKNYRVERKIKRKGSTEAKAWCGEKVIAGPKPRDVNEAVEKAIEMNYNLFSRAVYSEQNEIDSFLRLTPTDRKAKFDELLDLERYENVRANAVTALNRLKGIARDRKNWIAEQRQLLSKEDEKTLVERIAKKERENLLLEKEIREKEKEAISLEKEVGALEEKEKEFRALKERLAQNRAVMQELESALGETKKESRGRSPGDVSKEKGLALDEIRALEKNVAGLQEKEEHARKKKQEFGKNAALSQRKAEELGRHLEELQGLGAECPTCRQRLEAKTREALAAETTAEMKKAAVEMEKALRLEAEENAAIESAKKGLEAARKKRDLLKEKEMGLGQLCAEMEKAAEKEKHLQGLLKENELLEAKAGKTDFDERLLLAKRKQAIEAKAGIGAVKKSIQANVQLAKEMRAGLERIGKAKKQVEETEERVKAIESSTEKMGLFTNSLIAAQSELREMLISTINQAMHDIWQNIYPYRDYVSAKMDVSEGSYELKAKERSGNWVRVEGILSGGERSAAAICIRIAFSLVLARNLSWLILDEPTHNLDRKAVETLGEMMQRHLPSIVEQVFVITHDAEMKKAASASLYFLEREKDEDAVTKPVLVQAES
ncbi:MAG: AAA family ATPase [archaeon]